MYIFADIKIYCNKSRFILEQKRLLSFFRYRKFLFFNVKDFIFNKYNCEIYILADIK